jgi:hypothetical protein
MFLQNVELSSPNLKFQQNNVKLDLAEYYVSKQASNGYFHSCINASNPYWVSLVLELFCLKQSMA